MSRRPAYFGISDEMIDYLEAKRLGIPLTDAQQKRADRFKEICNSAAIKRADRLKKFKEAQELIAEFETSFAQYDNVSIFKVPNVDEYLNAVTLVEGRESTNPIATKIMERTNFEMFGELPD